MEAAAANSVGLSEFVGPSMGGEGAAEMEAEANQFSRQNTGNRMFEGVAEGGNEASMEARGMRMGVSAGRGFNGMIGEPNMNQMNSMLTQPTSSNSSSNRYPVPDHIRNQIMNAFQSSSSQTNANNQGGGNSAIESAIMSLIMHRINSTPGGTSGPNAARAMELMNSMHSQNGMEPFDPMGGMGGMSSFMGSNMGGSADMMSMMGGTTGMRSGMSSFNNIDTTSQSGQDISFSGSGSSPGFSDISSASQSFVDSSSPTSQHQTTFETQTQATAFDNTMTDQTGHSKGSSSNSEWGAALQSLVDTVKATNVSETSSSSMKMDKGGVITVEQYNGGTTDNLNFGGDGLKISSSFASQNMNAFDHGMDPAFTDTTKTQTTFDQKIVHTTSDTNKRMDIPVVVSKRVQTADNSQLNKQSQSISDRFPSSSSVTVGLGRTTVNDSPVKRVERVEAIQHKSPSVGTNTDLSKGSKTVVSKETKITTITGHDPSFDRKTIRTETTSSNANMPVVIGHGKQTEVKSVSKQSMRNGVKIINTQTTSDHSSITGGTIGNTGAVESSAKMNDIPAFIGDRLKVPSKSVTIETTVDASGSANNARHTDSNVKTSDKTITVTKISMSDKSLTNEAPTLVLKDKDAQTSTSINLQSKTVVKNSQTDIENTNNLNENIVMTGANQNLFTNQTETILPVDTSRSFVTVDTINTIDRNVDNSNFVENTFTGFSEVSRVQSSRTDAEHLTIESSNLEKGGKATFVAPAPPPVQRAEKVSKIEVIKFDTSSSTISPLPAAPIANVGVGSSTEKLTIEPMKPLADTVASANFETQTAKDTNLSETIFINTSPSIITETSNINKAVVFDTQNTVLTSTGNSVQMETISISTDAPFFDATVPVTETSQPPITTWASAVIHNASLEAQQTETKIQTISNLPEVTSTHHFSSSLSNTDIVPSPRTTIHKTSSTVRTKEIYPETTELSGPLAAKIAKALQGGKRNERVTETRSVSDGFRANRRSNPLRNRQRSQFGASSAISTQSNELDMIQSHKKGTESTKSFSSHISDTADAMKQALETGIVTETTPLSSGFDVVKTSAMNNGKKQNIFLLTQNKDITQTNMLTSETVSGGTEIANADLKVIGIDQNAAVDNHAASNTQETKTTITETAIDNNAGFNTQETKSTLTETFNAETIGPHVDVGAFDQLTVGLDFANDLSKSNQINSETIISPGTVNEALPSSVSVDGLGVENIESKQTNQLFANDLSKSNQVTETIILPGTVNEALPSSASVDALGVQSIESKQTNQFSTGETTSFHIKKVSNGQRQAVSGQRLDLPNPVHASETTHVVRETVAMDVQPIVQDKNMNVQITVDKISPPIIHTSSESRIVETMEPATFNLNTSGRTVNKAEVASTSQEQIHDIASLTNNQINQVEETIIVPTPSVRTTLGGSVVNFANGGVTKKQPPTRKQRPFMPPDTETGSSSSNTFRTISITQTETEKSAPGNGATWAAESFKQVRETRQPAQEGSLKTSFDSQGIQRTNSNSRTRIHVQS